MYVEFWRVENPDFKIESLIQIQNEQLLEIDPEAKFSYNTSVKRKDNCNTKIRIAEICTYPALEVTGFVQFEEYIFFIVLFTPKELLNKNLRKLQFLLKVAYPSHISFDNSRLIEQCLNETKKLTDNQKKADNLYQIGKWYKQMLDNEKALFYFRQAIDCFPSHYSHLKDIISETLSLGLYEEAKQYSTQLFNIEPTNPTVPQDLIQLFFDSQNQNLLIELFQALIDHNTDNEVLGNLHLHLALTYFNIGVKQAGLTALKTAKLYFKRSLDRNHKVFKLIEKLEKNKNWA